MGIIDKAKDLAEQARVKFEEREAQREIEAQGRMLNRQDAAVQRRGAGKLSQEGFETRYKESETLYQKERKTPERRIKEGLVSVGQRIMAPPPKPASRPRKRRPGRPTQVVRRSREIRAPAQPRGEFGFGGMELPGWGSSGRKRKGGFGGLGLL